MSKKSSKKKSQTQTNIVFDASCYDYLMRNNGCSVGFNMPPALTGNSTHKLPPYRKRMPYLVDKYPACPSDWMRSEGIIKSYFVPVVEGHGMWIDFNENDNNNHHVAIVISIQGINPITGLPCQDAQLEQYIEECPKHKIKFGPDRFCKKCDFKWPKQNYICTTGTPHGNFWLDGFKAANGIVRQYILTAEKMRGVASNIIGKDRVYAIGISFFLSKEKKTPLQNEFLRSTMGIYTHTPDDNSVTVYNSSPQFFSPVHTPINWQIPSTNYCDDTKGVQVNTSSLSKGGSFSTSTGAEICLNALNVVAENKSGKRNETVLMKKMPSDGATYSKKEVDHDIQSRSPIQVKKLEVGAGAKIDQPVYDDPEKLDYWHDKPESIICINYCSEVEAEKIIKGGMINIEGNEECFLKNIPVGN